MLSLAPYLVLRDTVAGRCRDAPCHTLFTPVTTVHNGTVRHVTPEQVTFNEARKEGREFTIKLSGGDWSAAP